ncbi:TerD family protein [Streptomyces scabiei]|uniref:TerD family protein n=3 Tax=Streptomyces scabiei TaxID=1930 RepID=UPI002FEF898D
MVIVASADPLQPGAVFTHAPQLTINQNGAPAWSFTAPDFAAGETVVVLAELYRRGDGWKVRAVGQGYASGLSGLAMDYGVDVDPEPAAAPSAPLPAQTRSAPAPASVDLAKVERQAPGLLDPAQQAGQALVNRGISGQRAAVYLILDHDWHMEELYESFAVQAFAERVLALSANLDDDGTAGPRRLPGSPRPGPVDHAGGPRKQMNTAPVDHGVLYAARSTKVPCSFLHHPLPSFPSLRRPAWRPSARMPRETKSAAWLPSSSRSPILAGRAGCATGSPRCWPWWSVR